MVNAARSTERSTESLEPSLFSATSDAALKESSSATKMQNEHRFNQRRLHLRSNVKKSQSNLVEANSRLKQ